MPRGLQIFSATGALTLEVTDKITRLHSVHNISASIPSVVQGFVAVSGMANDGTWFVTSGMNISAPGIYVQVHCYVTTGGFNWYLFDSGIGAPITVPITVFRL